MNSNMVPFKLFSPSFTNIFFILLPIIFLVETALSADRHFEVCEPRNCGSGPNISYPFWMDSQESYCGYPDYHVRCFNQMPVLNFSNHDYFVRKISYKNNFLLIANTEYFNTTCPYPLHNLTDVSPFIYSEDDNVYVNFFLNCNGSFPPMGSLYNISCLSNTTHYSFTSVSVEPFLMDATNCESQIITLVVNEGTIIDSLEKGNYSYALENGLLLEWTPSYICSDCESSGGRCGRNRSIEHKFLCFCPDGPHSRRCPEDGQSADIHYEACEPRSCSGCEPLSCIGGPQIRFPFWTDGQESYCGYPGFYINCTDYSWPFLKLSDENYYPVNEIFYENQTLLIETTVFNESACRYPLQNFTTSLPPFLEVSPDNYNLSFFYNCTDQYPSKFYNIFYISCMSNITTHHSFLTLEQQQLLDNCESHVISPIGADDWSFLNNILNRNSSVYERYDELYAFSEIRLKWNALNCNECRASGGRCGYNSSTSNSMCFCFDGPHSRSCNDSRLADKRYEACEPRFCYSGPQISYPFWTDGQESYCGYPEFHINCADGKPILKLSDEDYQVDEFFYENQSLLISNLNVLQSTCPYPLQNFTSLPPFLELSHDNYNIFFFYRCAGLFPSEFHNISCISNSTHHSFFFLDQQLLGNCESHVILPIVYDDWSDVYNLLSRNDFDNNQDYPYYQHSRILLKWNAKNCSECEESGGRCGYNSSTTNFLCFCLDGLHSRNCNDYSHKLSMKEKVAIGAASFIVTIAIVLVLICLLRKKKEDSSQNVKAFLASYGALAPTRYNYLDVKKMTNSFRDKLGEGGYGTVFKGKLIDGPLVAVKVFSGSKGNGEEFINEVASISRTDHVNIVTLLGFCSEGRRRALIYEFMPNGSLEKFIYNKETRESNALGWDKLYKIAVGIARGLEYLHRGCNTRILHFDIKPHNILLDQDFHPKISDFGLAKLCPTRESTISMVDARGTAGYIAPEVFCRNLGGVSYKSDVYSYGMMILEMVGGRKNIDARVDNTSEIYFPHWIYNRLDLNKDLGLDGVKTEGEKESARKMILVGLWCIQTQPANRPSMSKVVEMLEGSLEVLQMPPKPFLSSPSRSV